MKVIFSIDDYDHTEDSSPVVVASVRNESIEDIINSAMNEAKTSQHILTVIRDTSAYSKYSKIARLVSVEAMMWKRYVKLEAGEDLSDQESIVLIIESKDLLQGKFREHPDTHSTICRIAEYGKRAKVHLVILAPYTDDIFEWFHGTLRRLADTRISSIPNASLLGVKEKDLKLFGKRVYIAHRGVPLNLK
jgi:hypothetical protein